MEHERELVVSRILDIEEHVYQFIRVGLIPHWAEVELTMPQLKVLLLVGLHKPMPTSQVARSLGMMLSTVTGIVDRLGSQGLVRRLEDPHDRRIVLLEATVEGKALIHRLLQASRDRLRAVLDRLTLEELQVVARALDLMHRASVTLGAEPLQEDSLAIPLLSAKSVLRRQESDR